MGLLSPMNSCFADVLALVGLEKQNWMETPIKQETVEPLLTAW